MNFLLGMFIAVGASLYHHGKEALVILVGTVILWKLTDLWKNQEPAKRRFRLW